MDLQLNERHCLVTGSYRGTGEIIARQLAAEGCRVVVHGFEPGQAEAIADTIDGATAVTGDLMSDDGARAVWEQANAAGPIDVLINNYGRAGRGSFTGSTSDDWHGMYEENVLSAARLVQLALPAMRERGWGRIINLGTIGSSRPNSRNPHYYAAKGALSTMTVSLAKEVAGDGITVNLVSPGIIHTAEVEQWLTERGRERGWGETWEEIEKHAVAEEFANPIGRLARREEVADLVCFLASPRAGYIHGQNIRVDGGLVDSVH